MSNVNDNNKEELFVVTEQGVFGELNNIKDPSKKKASQEEVEEMIRQANERNLNNLK